MDKKVGIGYKKARREKSVTQVGSATREDEIGEEN